MARDRIEPCVYYICAGECQKGREANHKGYCQKCGKYKPRVKKKGNPKTTFERRIIYGTEE